MTLRCDTFLSASGALLRADEREFPPEPLLRRLNGASPLSDDAADVCLSKRSQSNSPPSFDVCLFLLLYSDTPIPPNLIDLRVNRASFKNIVLSVIYLNYYHNRTVYTKLQRLFLIGIFIAIIYQIPQIFNTFMY